MKLIDWCICLAVGLYVILLSSLALLSDQDLKSTCPILFSVVEKCNVVVLKSGWLLTVIAYLLLNLKRFLWALFPICLYTGNWYLVTSLFNYIKYEVTDKSLDISGHIFMLSFSFFVLYPSFLAFSQGFIGQNIASDIAFAYSSFCLFMTSITALFYHTWVEKTLAIIISIATFWVTSTFVQILNYKVENLAQPKMDYEKVKEKVTVPGSKADDRDC